MTCFSFLPSHGSFISAAQLSANPASTSSTTTGPGPLPTGQEERYAGGLTYSVDHNTETTTREDPQLHPSPTTNGAGALPSVRSTRVWDQIARGLDAFKSSEEAVKMMLGMGSSGNESTTLPQPRYRTRASST
jgi:hypothetical protein